MNGAQEPAEAQRIEQEEGRAERGGGPWLRVLLGLFLLLFPACAAQLPPPPAASADEGLRRQRELDWLVEALRRLHPDLYSETPAARFDAEVAELRASLPESSGAEAFVGLLRLVALVGDSHTRLADWDPIEELQLPLRFQAHPEGWWVQGVQPEHAELFACRLLALEGLPPEACAERLEPLVPHENEILARKGVARLFSLPQALAALGLARDTARVTLTLRDPDGAVREVVLEAQPRETLTGWVAIAPPGWSEPLYRTRMGERWWWTELPAARALYLQYNRCADDPESPFAELASEVLARLDRGGLDRLVIDLRLNGGGDTRVLEPLLAGLRRRREWRGERVAALIGNDTYSSAMLNALVLRRDLGAVLVGEPTGQKPNGFGDVRVFPLPFSGLRVSCSTRRFHVLDGDPPSLAPDVFVPTSLEDLYLGRDPVLERVLAGALEPDSGLERGRS